MINCLIVDDEPYAIELLTKHIAAFDSLSIVGKCRNVKEAIRELQSVDVDLIFLDVRMPDITGIEFLENITHPPKVVLTTAYRNYAVQAFEYGVLDYLVKPISFMRFTKAIDRYKQSVLNIQLVKNDMKLPIIIRSGAELHKIIPEEIIQIKSAKEYVSIHCEYGKYLIRSSMRDILNQLPQGAFIQVHKSYIVPLQQIQTITTNDILLMNGDKVPLGRSYLNDVRKLFTV